MEKEKFTDAMNEILAYAYDHAMNEILAYAYDHLESKGIVTPQQPDPDPNVHEKLDNIKEYVEERMKEIENNSERLGVHFLHLQDHLKRIGVLEKSQSIGDVVFAQSTQSNHGEEDCK